MLRVRLRRLEKQRRRLAPVGIFCGCLVIDDTDAPPYYQRPGQDVTYTWNPEHDRFEDPQGRPDLENKDPLAYDRAADGGWDVRGEIVLDDVQEA
jgi:hypothetical protein